MYTTPNDLQASAYLSQHIDCTDVLGGLKITLSKLKQKIRKL